MAQRQYILSTETFAFRLATTGGGEFPAPTAQPPSAQRILQASPDTRAVTLSVSLFSPDGSYVRVIPPAALANTPSATPLPFIIWAFRQGPVGGEQRVGPVSGVGQGARFADIVVPDVPKTYTIPPRAEMFANVRGGTIPPPPASLAPSASVSTVFLSVVTTSIVEAEVDQRSQYIVEGVKRALAEVIPDAILTAARRLGIPLLGIRKGS